MLPVEAWCHWPTAQVVMIELLRFRSPHASTTVQTVTHIVPHRDMGGGGFTLAYNHSSPVLGP